MLNSETEPTSECVKERNISWLFIALLDLFTAKCQKQMFLFHYIIELKKKKTEKTREHKKKTWI